MSNSHLTEKGLVAMALVVFLGGGFTAGTWYWVNRFDFVAKVNGERITRTVFARSLEQAQHLYTRQLGLDLKSPQGKALLPMLKETTLNQLIDNQLLLNEAQKRQITISDAEVEAEFEKLLKTNYQGKRDRMESELARNNFSVPDFRRELKERQILKKMRELLSAGAKVSDKDAISYFEQNKKNFNQPEKIEAAHILFKVEKPAQDAAARQKAEKLLGELKAGADFKALAKKHSEDSSNKDKGGDLGAFAKGDMVPSFESAAWALKPGEYTQTPVKTDFGYHLILRGRTLPAGPVPLAEARKQFEPQLQEQAKDKAYRAWLTNTRKQAEITIAEDMQRPAPPALPASTASASSGSVSPSGAASAPVSGKGK
jgi:parvulin-like peptidyl-prolyl isomerase